MITTAQISDLTKRFAPIKTEEMTVDVMDGKRFRHPVIDTTWRERSLPRGRTERYQLTIAEANAGKFHYAFLDDETLERYAGAYRVVTKDCEAAKANGMAIPEKYFNAQKVIFENGSLYCYCTWEYFEKSSQLSENRGARVLASFMKGLKGQEKDSDGRVLGSVENTGLSSRLVEVPEKPPQEEGK